MIRGFDTGYTMEDKNNVLATMRSRWVTLAPHIREKRPHGQIMSRNGAGVHDVDSICSAVTGNGWLAGLSCEGISWY